MAKGIFSKLVVLLVIIMNIAFTVAILYIFFKKGNEPAVLISCWFAFTTGELWMLSGIKKQKIKADMPTYPPNYKGGGW